MAVDPLKALKARIAELYDADALVDILGISSAQLLEAFEFELTQSEELMHIEVEE